MGKEACDSSPPQAICHLPSAISSAAPAISGAATLLAVYSTPLMGSDAKHRPVYVISVAAELVDMHPQTLRLYERKGLIRPGRSSGKTRLYSERDIEHLREIRRLTQELGVNLAGVEEIMRLRHELDASRAHLEGNVRRLQDDLSERMTKWRTLPSPSGPENIPTGEDDTGE